MKNFAIVFTVAVAITGAGSTIAAEMKTAKKAAPGQQETFETVKRAHRTLAEVEADPNGSPEVKATFKRQVLDDLESCTRRATLASVPKGQRDAWIGACYDELSYQRLEALNREAARRQAANAAALAARRQEEQRQQAANGDAVLMMALCSMGGSAYDAMCGRQRIIVEQRPTYQRPRDVTCTTRGNTTQCSED